MMQQWAQGKPIIPAVIRQRLSSGRWTRGQAAIILSSIGILIGLVVILDWQHQKSVLDWPQASSPTSQVIASNNQSRASNSIGTPESSSGLSRPTESLVGLPSDFPKVVPIFPGRVVDASRSEVAQRKSWTVTVVAESEVNPTVRTIQQSLSAKGWNKDSELVDDQGVTFAASSGSLSIVVYVSGTSHRTEIRYTVSQQAAN